MQLTMDVGEQLGHLDHEIAEVLAPIALLGDDVVEHAVLGEAPDEPGDVQDVALRRVVGVPDDCFVVVRHLALLSVW